MADKVFYPNACYVCQKYGVTINLIFCTGCRMIRYCSKEHQEEHWPYHQTICNAIKEALKDDHYMNTKEISRKDWTIKKIHYMKQVSDKMRRSLTITESQMFWFPRACVVCHRQDILIDCNYCPCVSFCDYKHELRSNHGRHCRKLKLCFELDTVEVPKSPDLSLFPISRGVAGYMEALLDNCVPSSGQASPSEFVKVVNSVFLTRPMTLYYVLQKLNFRLNRGNLVVHIIASHSYDINDTVEWEPLLHIMSYLISLTIINIGPDLKNATSVSGPVCHVCVNAKKTIEYEYVPKLYRDYVHTEAFIKPDVIIGYDVIPYQIYNKNDSTVREKLSAEWIASAEAIMEQKCPYILTFNIEPNIKEEMAKCSFLGLNPFNSYRPFRDILSEKPCYSNEHIVIFEKLKNSLILVYESENDVDLTKSLLEM